jgi:hypothetical protein
MRSPGRPTVNGREVQRRFWSRIAEGLSSEDAAAACGVSSPVVAVVSRVWRDATFTSAAAIGTVSVVRRARRDRAVEGLAAGDAPGRPADRSERLDGLA